MLSAELAQTRKLSEKIRIAKSVANNRGDLIEWAEIDFPVHQDGPDKSLRGLARQTVVRIL